MKVICPSFIIVFLLLVAFLFAFLVGDSAGYTTLGLLGAEVNVDLLTALGTGTIAFLAALFFLGRWSILPRTDV